MIFYSNLRHLPNTQILEIWQENHSLQTNIEKMNKTRSAILPTETQYPLPNTNNLNQKMIML